ncbi:hydrolase [Vibrio brasiliensis]|uniref:hydrolase n=1 Tax=Vibrio brasiliensis TaxID=170652 RepID=UPI001EFCF641|nr:hydrolase [Vibrio brasiliensis]MCG9649180.1 hydrolase [Vibrio brasiliensis]MCG9725306.1 hydrolase [Vibrio brasiliensis]
MLDRTNTGLVIVDVQGKLASLVHDSDTLIANCAKLIQGAQLLGLPIVWLEQNPEKLGPTVDSVRQLLKDVTPISKFTFNGCGEPEFVEAVRQANVENFLLCGIEAHICVYQTALALAQRDYDVHLVTDCISSRLEQNKQLSVRKLLNKGIDITCLEMCLYELVKDCRSDEFRSILKLIK